MYKKRLSSINLDKKKMTREWRVLLIKRKPEDSEMNLNSKFKRKRCDKNKRGLKEKNGK
jgi:hypothetical protein